MLQEFNRLGGGNAHASMQYRRGKILHVQTLLLERKGPWHLVTTAAGGVIKLMKEQAVRASLHTDG